MQIQVGMNGVESMIDFAERDSFREAILPINLPVLSVLDSYRRLLWEEGSGGVTEI